ncbi:MAG: DUF1385 domain-containing protein [Candidatus Sumerlaeia bacterium]
MNSGKDKQKPTSSEPREVPKDFAMGGQAVLEGVMMRGPRRYAVAVRRPQGDIRLVSKSFWPVVERKKWLKIPIVRGAVSLIEMMMLGYKSLDYSANVADQAMKEMEDSDESEEAGKNDGEKKKVKSGPSHVQLEEDEFVAETVVPVMADPTSDEPYSSMEASEAGDEDSRSISRWAMAGMFVFSMGLGMLLFVALPNAATHFLPQLFGGSLVEKDQPLLFNLVSGLARVIVIVGYIWAISLLKDVRRLFQYHGAEHKVVMTWEKKEPLDIDHVRPNTKLHPRCGTTFIAIVILVSVVIFAILAALIVELYPPFENWSVWARKPLLIGLHILFMPVVAGLAYEITRRAGRNPDFWLYRFLLLPGFAFQHITTREPDDSMIEVALVAFKEALEPEQAADLPEEKVYPEAQSQAV